MRWLIGAALALLPVVVAAQEPRFCPNRPDLGASTCTTDPGRVLVEISSADWQLDRRDGTREDQFLAGDLLIRTGLDDRTELQLAWTPLARVRSRDTVIDDVVGSGDVRVGVRRNLLSPDGEGFSLAVEPFVTVPTGGRAIGRDDWSAGVVLPISWSLSDWSLGFTGEAIAEVDADGAGRHPAYAGTVGLGRDLSSRVSAVVELSARRDDDPAGGETQLLSAASVAWLVRDTMQLDLLGVVGLNRTSPDFRIAIGGAVLF